MSENEVWKDIPEYRGKYQVSNLGRVKLLPREQLYGVGKTKLMPEKVLMPEAKRFGSGVEKALTVLLFKDGKGTRYLVKKLVADAFLEVPENYSIHYKDGNYGNCKANNLEALSYHKRKERSLTLPVKPKKITGTNADTGAIVEFSSIEEANCFCGAGTDDKGIVKVCLGLRKHAYGYFWTYS